MKEYNSAESILYQIGGLVTLVGTAGFTILWITAGIWNGEPLSYALCYSGLFILAGGWPGFAMFNLYPSVWVVEDGLVISYNLVGRAFIPWEELIEIKRVLPPWMGYLVIAKRITPWHRLYGGWRLPPTHRPGFLISNRMKDREKLIGEIQKHIQQKSIR